MACGDIVKHANVGVKRTKVTGDFLIYFTFLFFLIFQISVPG